eukprot:1319486-Prymnesium_polylepis.1
MSRSSATRVARSGGSTSGCSHSPTGGMTPTMCRMPRISCSRSVRPGKEDVGGRDRRVGPAAAAV